MIEKEAYAVLNWPTPEGQWKKEDDPSWFQPSTAANHIAAITRKHRPVIVLLAKVMPSKTSSVNCTVTPIL
jgi:hypothetical protein